MDKISLRQIAASLSISHGNLSYHYKTKEDILNEIYTRMENEMSDVVFPEGDLTLTHYNNLLHRISEFQKRHRFFYLDMLSISRNYPEIIKRYRITLTRRSLEYVRLIKHFESKGLVRQEPEEGFYLSLFHSIWVMSAFWLQHQAILGKNHDLIQTGSDIKHVWEILLPHLTMKGLKEYRSIIGNDSWDQSPLHKAYLKVLKK